MPSDQDCVPDLIVRAEDWPHGLKCPKCHRVMEEGDRYSEQLTGMAGEIPVVLIVCRLCAEGRHTTVTS